MDLQNLEKIKRFDVQFAESVAAGAAGDLEYMFTAPCSIEKMIITFPIGSRGELQITPYVLRPDLGVEDLITYVGSRFVIGDNVVKPYSPAKHVQYGYKIVIHYNNTGADAHSFEVAVACDSLYGPVRVDAGKGVRR